MMAFSGTLQKCKVCDKTVYFMDQLIVDGISYHKSCFKRNHCKGTLKFGGSKHAWRNLYVHSSGRPNPILVTIRVIVLSHKESRTPVLKGTQVTDAIPSMDIVNEAHIITCAATSIHGLTSFSMTEVTLSPVAQTRKHFSKYWAHGTSPMIQVEDLPCLHEETRSSS